MLVNMEGSNRDTVKPANAVKLAIAVGVLNLAM